MTINEMKEALCAYKSQLESLMNKDEYAPEDSDIIMEINTRVSILSSLYRVCNLINQIEIESE